MGTRDRRERLFGALEAKAPPEPGERVQPRAAGGIRDPEVAEERQLPGRGNLLARALERPASARRAVLADRERDAAGADLAPLARQIERNRAAVAVAGELVATRAQVSKAR